MNKKDLPKWLQKKPTKKSDQSEEHIASVSSPIQYAQQEVQPFLNPITLPDPVQTNEDKKAHKTREELRLLAHPKTVRGDPCGLCLTKLTLHCDYCTMMRSERWRLANPCTVTVGACDHAFHTHCLSRWLKMFGHCQECKVDWVHKATVKRQ